MFENPRRGRQARNFTTNAPKILDLKSSSEQIFSRKLPLGALALCSDSSWRFVFAQNSWKLSENQILRLSKVFLQKHVFQARYVIMVIVVNYIPRLNLYIRNNIFKDFWGKKTYKEFWS